MVDIIFHSKYKSNQWCIILHHIEHSAFATNVILFKKGYAKQLSKIKIVRIGNDK